MSLNILRFGWRNIWRNKKRTNLTIFAIAVGVMTVIFSWSYIQGIITGASREMINNRIGHIKIAHKEYLRLERIMPKEHLVKQADQLEKEISALDGVKLVYERIKFNALLSRGDFNEPAVAVGIEPAKADQVMNLSCTLTAGHYLNDNGLNLIIGKSLAQKLNVAVNDELLLVTTDINYSTYALPFNVAGIFETGYSALDKYLIYIPLAKAREVLDCGNAAHEFLVFLDHPEKAVEIAKTIEPMATRDNPSDLAVIPWQKDDFMANLIPSAQKIPDIILGFFMFIVAMVILNTMLMAVMERYHEIGVIKALGFKNREVIGMLLVEAFYIGVIGSVLGGIFGGGIAAALEKKGIDFTKLLGQEVWEQIDIPLPFMSKVAYPDFNGTILMVSILFGILVALVAVLYPAFKSSRMSPVEALRTQLNV